MVASLAYDLATYGYQRGEPCDPGPDWSAWNAGRSALHRTARPEAAVAGVVTAHARLLEVVARVRSHWATASGGVKVVAVEGSGAGHCSGATAGAGRTGVVIVCGPSRHS